MYSILIPFPKFQQLAPFHGELKFLKMLPMLLLELLPIYGVHGVAVRS